MKLRVICKKNNVNYYGISLPKPLIEQNLWLFNGELQVCASGQALIFQQRVV